MKRESKILYFIFLLALMPSCKERVSPMSQAKFTASQSQEENIFVTSLGFIDVVLRSRIASDLQIQMKEFGLQVKQLEFVLTTVVRPNGALSESVPALIVNSKEEVLSIGAQIPARHVMLFECAFDDGLDDDSSHCELRRGREVVGKSEWSSRTVLKELCSGATESKCKVSAELISDDNSNDYRLTIQPK